VELVDELVELPPTVPGGSSDVPEGETGAIRPGSPGYRVVDELALEPLGGKTANACWPGVTS
jgi:hypothetical protein